MSWGRRVQGLPFMNKVKRVLLELIGFAFTSLLLPAGDLKTVNPASPVARPAEMVVRVNEGSTTAFPLVQGQEIAALAASAEDAEVVRIALVALAGDIEHVSSQKPAVLSGVGKLPAYCVLAGTLGSSPLIDGLVAAGKLDAAPLQGQWERYIIKMVEAPFPGVKKALIVVGSDKRGTAYGVFSISRSIGVSPWVWWANAVPAKTTNLWLAGGEVVSTSPVVKYRGIFLNDEDWGLQPWAASKHDTDIKDIGPKTYARIFELLLRLRANMIWPAMHHCTKAFYYYPENPATADRYAIVVGSSHCEPMLRNNVDEWGRFTKKDKSTGAENANQEQAKGEFRYDTNAEQVNRYWRERVAQAANYESIYTIGMRGLHDGNMVGPKTMPEKLSVMGQVIQAQQGLLSDGLKRKSEDIPQIFCPYKEVLEIYQAGLKLPPEVTLVWPDDNHGYMRRLSTPEEQKRSGGSGVYYHLSYWGAPEDYLWLCSTSPSLISLQMHKALATGADRLWVFNVGDIKPAEMEMEFALDLAWNPAQWTPEKAPDYAQVWAGKIFGEAVAGEIAAIKAEYYNLAQAGKPEHVWRIAHTQSEAEVRLARYAALGARAQALAAQIPAALKDAYFQLVLYPTVGAFKMNEKVLSVQLGNLEKAKNAQAEIKAITRMYNEDIAGGQWRGMMDWQPRKQTAFLDPEVLLQPPPLKNGKPAPRVVALSTDKIVAEVDLAKPDNTQDVPGASITYLAGLGAPRSVSRVPWVGPGFEPATAPWVEYKVPVTAGRQSIHLRFLPTHAIHSGLGLRVGVAIDTKPAAVSSIDSKEYSPTWRQNVIQGFAQVVIPHEAAATGAITVRVYLLDPGLVLTGLQVRTAGAFQSDIYAKNKPGNYKVVVRLKTASGS